MKIFSYDKSTLMEIADVDILDGAIVIKGKIMGAMPLKAIVPPSEMRVLLRQVGLKKAARILWLLLTGASKPA